MLQIHCLTMFTNLGCGLWSWWFGLSPFPSMGYFGISLGCRNHRTISVPVKFPLLWDSQRCGKLPTNAAETTQTHFLMKYAAKAPLQKGEEGVISSELKAKTDCSIICLNTGTLCRESYGSWLLSLKDI